VYAIVDANNFYASCERLFKPNLLHVPIVVLSNNDGCVIARSNEAKAIGIKMGEPYFQIKHLINKHKIKVFSSNYAFYGDMSNRIMSVLESNWPEMEVYSIDEAFLFLKSLPVLQHTEFCQQLQRKVKQYTGIPVSIGIGPTKTLAKLANYVAKKQLKTSVFNICNELHWLKQIDVGEVWGIGRKWSTKLKGLGINTAYDLSQVDSRTFKRKFNVVLERTILELRGISCISLEEAEPKQEIISSKSFGQLQTNHHFIAEALSSYVARAVEKMRKQNSLATTMTVFLRTNPFRKDLPYYSKSTGFQLVNPTDDVRILTRFAKLCLKQIYLEGYHYKKTGVLLGGLIDRSQHQYTLFDSESDDDREQSENLMQAITNINQKFGRHAVHLAAEGVNKHQSWKMKSIFKSPHYTTCWEDIPIVFAH